MMQIQIERAYSCLAWRVSVTFFICFSLARGRVGALARLWCCAFTELPAAAMVCLVLSPSCQWMSLACVCGVVLSPSCQQLPWCAWCFHRAASICAHTCTCVVVAMSMFDWDDIELPAVSTHQKILSTEMDELPTPAKHNPRFAKSGRQPRPSQKAARITN